MEPVVVGWHEPIALDELGLERIFAKLDTGADHCALHAQAIVRLPRLSEVEFTAPLLRRQTGCLNWQSSGVRRVRARLVDERMIRSSNGRDEARMVIETPLTIGSSTFGVRFSLCDRSAMRFPVLLGRSALSGRFLVDSGQAHLVEAAHCLDQAGVSTPLEPR